MFDSKAKIKVLVIGKDGVARKHWVDHDAEFFDNKYKIDYEAVYQSLDGGILGYGGKPVPTILFRENSVVAISFKTKPTMPDPDEMGSSISRAAWAIAELMRKRSEQAMAVMMALMVVACLIAAAGAYISFDNGKKIDALKTQIAGMAVNTQPTDIVPGSPTVPTVPTQPSQPAPVQPVGTPVPQISVT